MAVLSLALVALAVSLAAGASLGTDTSMVGSSVHQATVTPPADLLPAADKAYRRTHRTNGGDGYKNFDSFHKKDGDSYGYEQHSSFGDKDSDEDGGEYLETSAYSSGDSGGSRSRPKITAYHYETKSGTPRDYSNYDPETYEGDYTNVVPRRTARPGVQVRYDITHTSSQNPASARAQTPRLVKGREPQTSGTEDDAEYDYYYEGQGDGDDSSAEDGGYSYYSDSSEGEYEGEDEGDYYY